MKLYYQWRSYKRKLRSCGHEFKKKSATKVHQLNKITVIQMTNFLKHKNNTNSENRKRAKITTVVRRVILCELHPNHSKSVNEMNDIYRSRLTRQSKLHLAAFASKNPIVKTRCSVATYLAQVIGR